MLVFDQRGEETLEENLFRQEREPTTNSSKAAVALTPSFCCWCGFAEVLTVLLMCFHSNKMNQGGGNIERRDVGDSSEVSSKLIDMQNAIESLTHSVNNVATKQQVSHFLLKV